jgi:4-amino-4-deoxy-L-arabinose transferase-like glycosyltransferase
MSAVVAGGLVARAGEAAALLTMSVVALGGILALVRVCRDPSEDPAAHARLLHWTVAAFAAHLAFGLVVTHSAALTNYLGPDAVTYQLVAKGIVRHWTAGVGMPQLKGGKEGFYYLLAVLFWVFGPYSSAGMALNAALAAALVPLVTDTTRRLFGPGPAHYAAPLMVLLPGLFLWSSQLLKEAPVLFLIAVACNCGIRIGDRVRAGPLFVLVASIGLLLSFRGPIGLVVGAGVVAGLVLGRKELVSGLAAGGVVAVLIGGFVLVGGVGKSGYQTAVASNLQKAGQTRQNLALAASSGFGGDIQTKTTGQALKYLPIGMFNFGLGPFPWQGGAARQLAAMPDVVVWWWLLPALWSGYREARRRIGRRIMSVVLPATTTWLVLVLTISNFGIVIREREQIVVLVAPLLALGLTVRSAQRASTNEAVRSSV